jgi:hypothetical protein
MFFATTLAIGQQSSRTDFEEFLEIMEGRWIGEVTWIADWPGFGSKGNKVTGYSDLKIIADGNALLATFYEGTGTGVWMVVYDAAAKQIRSLQANTGGTTFNFVWYKVGANWTLAGNGSKADGSKIDFQHTLSITNGGNTHTYTGTTRIDGKKVDDRQDIWRRINK